MKIDKLEELTTTNLVENFNSIRIKYDGGKNKNYIMKGLFDMRTFCAVLRVNIGI